MRRRKIFGSLVVLGLGIVVASGIALLTLQPANAQCGSQASSCKNCHETQGKSPVNNDGTGWHQSHAFGDFCYICHGGNNQAVDETAAHASMVAPLSDVQAACAQCHPDDLQARAEVYAVKLGVRVGAPASAPVEATPAAAASEVVPTATLQAAPVSQGSMPASNNPNLVDYVQRYNQQVLDQQPTNWGNVILIALVVLLLITGGFFVVRREGWVSVSFAVKKPMDKEYPADVTEIAAQVAALKPAVRTSLARLLGKPRAASDLLTALERISTGDTPEDEG